MIDDVMRKISRCFSQAKRLFSMLPVCMLVTLIAIAA
jgi:hypothetical protein